MKTTLEPREELQEMTKVDINKGPEGTNITDGFVSPPDHIQLHSTMQVHITLGGIVVHK